MKNYYAILEVPVGCSLEEIRQAYRRLSQASLDDPAAFADLKEAYEALTTPARRAEYDLAAWGETFAAGAGGDRTLGMAGEAVPVRPGRCPMGAEAQCPILQGHIGDGDKFCPECGYLLASLGAGSGDADGPEALSRLARLEGPEGETHRLRAGLNVVGREAADVLLPDKTVSRQHARVEVSPEGAVTVEDLSSTNGTQVNGDVLTPHLPRGLSDGDRLRFGSVATLFRLPPGPSANPVPALSAPASSAPPGDAAPDVHTQGPARAKVVELREGDGREYFLVPGVTTFGRRSENSVVLPGDPYVSGSHAQIIADGDLFRLTDVGSTNGTLRNGERLPLNEPVTLAPGDVILIGGTALRFDRIADAPAEDAEPPDAPGPDAPEPDAPDEAPAIADAPTHSEG